MVRVSGDHPELARDEVLSLLELFGVRCILRFSKGVYLTIQIDEMNAVALGEILGRAGLLLAAGVPAPPGDGRYNVEVWRVKKEVDADEARRRIREVRAELGKRGVEIVLSGRGRGDAALYLSRDETLFLKILHRRGGEILKRSNTYRPFRKPISMDPRLARACVNLLRIPLGEVFLDPFCGTGGIAIEAALLGYRTFIADADPEMVQGALLNFHSLSLNPNFHVVSEVRDLPCYLPERAYGLATDLPYGRSSRTFGNPVDDLLSNLDGLVKSGGKALLVLHQEETVEKIEAQHKVLKRYEERVHRSLLRRFILLSPD